MLDSYIPCMCVPIALRDGGSATAGGHDTDTGMEGTEGMEEAPRLRHTDSRAPLSVSCVLQGHEGGDKGQALTIERRFSPWWEPVFANTPGDSRPRSPVASGNPKGKESSGAAAQAAQGDLFLWRPGGLPKRKQKKEGTRPPSPSSSEGERARGRGEGRARQHTGLFLGTESIATEPQSPPSH